jgi:hypothetical protein
MRTSVGLRHDRLSDIQPSLSGTRVAEIAEVLGASTPPDKWILPDPPVGARAQEP